MPRMINPRAQAQTNLTDDLRPHVQRGGSRSPFRKRQRRPELITFIAGIFHSNSASARRAGLNAGDHHLTDIGVPQPNIEH